MRFYRKFSGCFWIEPVNKRGEIIITGDGFSVHKIGIYVRESRDENEENYETIETQRDLLIDYVKKNKLGEIKRVYIDDNVSGAGFERKGIEELKTDVSSSEIDLLIIKDLSRLGRNNAKTLLFLDFLEEKGVRVITFDGRYDSIRDNDTVGIDTWYNERYVRDISRKIRTNLQFKIQKGEYIGNAPYGYEKSQLEKNKLVVNK
jgi:DNA invertase Pin-like site-specific DNA recombinase